MRCKRAMQCSSCIICSLVLQSFATENSKCEIRCFASRGQRSQMSTRLTTFPNNISHRSVSHHHFGDFRLSLKTSSGPSNYFRANRNERFMRQNEFFGLWRENIHLFENEIYLLWATAKDTRTHKLSRAPRRTRSAQKSQMIKWWPRSWRRERRRIGGEKWNGNQTENSMGTWHSPNKMANWCGRFNL